MNRYPEAIGVLNSLIVKDNTKTKVLIDLAECYKLTGNSRRAANCYQKAMNLQPENKFFRLQFIRSLLASEDQNAKEAYWNGGKNAVIKRNRSFLTLYYLGVTGFTVNNLKKLSDGSLKKELSGKRRVWNIWKSLPHSRSTSDSMMVRLYDGLVRCYDYAGDTKERGGSGEVIYLYKEKTPFFIK